MKFTWYNSKWVVILLHTVSWITIFALPFLIRTSNEQHKPPPDNGFLHFYIVSRFLWIGLFYLNALYIFPKLLPQKKLWFVAATQVIIVFIISILQWICFYFFVKKSAYDFSNFFVYNIFTYLFILAASVAYSLVLDKIQSERIAQQRVNENLKTELSFLRSQVSPHFMFNVLNNMVALARKKSDLLEPSLIKLSSLMRYMLYESDENQVPLEKEIEYVESYIDLQQQRFGKNVAINISLNNIDNHYQIEPMLLIPFVENAFKHGTGMIVNAAISVELVAKNNLLQFTVRNKFNDASGEVKDKTSGIGLSNTQRRLNLLYGNNHSLLINKKDGWFTVSLQLNLH